jgi:hypothetical protein
MALTQHDIAKYLIIGHLNMANSNAQAKDLFELELDGGAYFCKLIGEILRVGNGSRELSGCRRQIRRMRYKMTAYYPWKDRGPKDEESALSKLQKQGKRRTSWRASSQAFCFYSAYTENEDTAEWSDVEIYILFEIVDGHVFKLDLLGTIDICGISKDTDGHARSGDIWKSGWT